MQTYVNTTDKSCVYDAFLRAGLPVEDRMLHGITGGEVIAILKQHGWTVLFKGESIPVFTKNVIVIRDFKKNFAHIEYHDCASTIDYPSESIGALAVKP